jgi:hypothetical protein
MWMAAIYVGPYSSHAPEELVPGAEFDTLDLRVYTRPAQIGCNAVTDSQVQISNTP